MPQTRASKSKTPSRRAPERPSPPETPSDAIESLASLDTPSSLRRSLRGAKRAKLTEDGKGELTLAGSQEGENAYATPAASSRKRKARPLPANATVETYTDLSLEDAPDDCEDAPDDFEDGYETDDVELVDEPEGFDSDAERDADSDADSDADKRRTRRKKLASVKFLLFHKRSVKGLEIMFLQMIPEQVQSVLGADNAPVGVYIGSGTECSTRGGIQKRIKQHIRTSSRDIKDVKEPNRHYSTICKPNTETESSSYSSFVSYDLSMEMRRHVEETLNTRLPDFGGMGLNSSWPLRQGFRRVEDPSRLEQSCRKCGWRVVEKT
ncbi:hypothetical protein LX32DRAFT_655576 [Colletotrichum zoysiae]|uniref:Uncharacterized protein n=1 Tax=Colletotrichum zoysiae TaxID=1216348 RepID=A0AAD9LY12_9PEZI|nr:hypothetical protein LX32DRAFT_655576 [Colletotrichum zoysiae]